MEMVSYDEDPEFSMVYENFSEVSDRKAAVKSPSAEDKKGTAAEPDTGVKICRLVAVGLGLMCIIQAALNISLRLAHFSLNNSLTEERDECKKINLGIEARFRNLTEERDELYRTVYDTTVIIQNLTKERNELKRMLNDSTQQVWVSFNGSFYYVSSTKKTWQDSRNDCLQRGADLMIINSQEEQNFARRFRKYMWVGLNDKQTEGRWEWVNGNAMTTSYWSEGEPNGGRRENCGNVKNFEYDYSWNDEDCSTSLFWVCEKKTFP
ncbi:CD209 antigen-like protein C [Mugil cephalus]|uniref:CD209 antigen-like protein C n=1 Tax=Mugil cephalus TaxID=48193 RepID=UPI001FB71657|nr:CD209 antigen-like protein C [Mugil cephalus]